MNQQLFKQIPFQFTVDLYQGLVAARRFQLQPALGAAINAVGVLKIDADLQRLVPESALNLLARLGLRGERVFPVPSIIIHAPLLIGYYRMLLGISKKEFGQAYRLGYGTWINAEETGKLAPRLLPLVDMFCTALIIPLSQAIEVMGDFNERDLSDITLLTLGSTLQGAGNNVIGSEAANSVFRSIQDYFTEEIILNSKKCCEFC